MFPPRSLHLFGSFLFALALLSGCGGSDTGTVATPAATPATPAAPAASPAVPVTLALQTVITGLSGAVFLTAPPADPRLYIVQRSGLVRIVENGVLQPGAFLDIRARVSTTGEGGLLSIAFDPNYALNGYIYAFFTDLQGNIAIERYTVSPGLNQALPMSALRILSIAHPGSSNHFGGLLAFGPDGMLYIGTGDGGGRGDPNGNAQNLVSLLGKMLRIDVAASSAVAPYTIPAGNPFLATPAARPEIWAYGLRNPWRFAFDPAAGLLYIADVGEAEREEINIVPASHGGLNFGWNIMEGTLCFDSQTCNTQGLVLPALEYGHDAASGNACAVIGGYVYRGNALPELAGQYFYTDFCTTWVKSFVFANGVAGPPTEWSGLGVTEAQSFGQDGLKELYLLSAAGGVYRIVRR